MFVAQRAVTEADLTQAQRLRVLAGFCVQPLAAAVLGFISFPLIALTHPALGGQTVMDPDGARAVAFGAAFVAVFVTAFGALPIAAWCVKRGPLTFRQVVGWGAVLGNLPFVVIVGLASITGNVTDQFWNPMSLVRALIFGVIFGVAGAAVFWLIAVRGTPLSDSESRNET